MGILAEAVANISSGPQPTLRESTLTFLADVGLSREIAEDLCSATDGEPLFLCHGGITIIPSSELESLNRNALYLPWLSDGYITIAQGACGDPIAVDVRTGRIAYIVHDEMDHRRTDIIPSNHVVHTPLAYDDFWSLATRYDLALRDPRIGESGIGLWLNLTGHTGVPMDAQQAESLWGRGERQTKQRETADDRGVGNN